MGAQVAAAAAAGTQLGRKNWREAGRETATQAAASRLHGDAHVPGGAHDGLHSRVQLRAVQVRQLDLRNLLQTDGKKMVAQSRGRLGGTCTLFCSVPLQLGPCHCRLCLMPAPDRALSSPALAPQVPCQSRRLRRSAATCLDLVHGDLADLLAVGLARPRLNPRRLLQQHRRGGRLQDESETAVLQASSSGRERQGRVRGVVKPTGTKPGQCQLPQLSAAGNHSMAARWLVQAPARLNQRPAGLLQPPKPASLRLSPLLAQPPNCTPTPAPPPLPLPHSHLVHRDLHGDDGPHFVLRRRVVLLAERHDVHTLQPRPVEMAVLGREQTECTPLGVKIHNSGDCARRLPKCCQPRPGVQPPCSPCYSQPPPLLAALAGPAAPVHCQAELRAAPAAPTARRRRTLAPRAGPTGGAGLALPAGSASLMRPVTARRSTVRYSKRSNQHTDTLWHHTIAPGRGGHPQPQPTWAACRPHMPCPTHPWQPSPSPGASCCPSCCWPGEHVAAAPRTACRCP